MFIKIPYYSKIEFAVFFVLQIVQKMQIGSESMGYINKNSNIGFGKYCYTCVNHKIKSGEEPCCICIKIKNKDEFKNYRSRYAFYMARVKFKCTNESITFENRNLDELRKNVNMTLVMKYPNDEVDVCYYGLEEL